MKKIRISSIWSHSDIKYSLLVSIIKNVLNYEITWTKPKNCDLLIVGPYEYNKTYRKFLKKTNLISIDIIQEFLRGVYFKKEKPITIFYTSENSRRDSEDCDFSIVSDFNYDNHTKMLSMPNWKEYIDWEDYGIIRPTNVLNSKRLGFFYKIEDLIKPQEYEFIKKRKDVCCFFTQFDNFKKQTLKVLNTYFRVDGYGPAFDINIKNHNSSNFIKKDILKNYFANFCPENEIYPGWYTEKVIDSYLCHSLPITWADVNINKFFNKNCFINLNSYDHEEYGEIFDSLKDENFLKKFGEEPLFNEKPNLEKEINFIKKILN